LRELLFSAPDISMLPKRVREAIERREWANEVLLRCLQLAVILLFCFIYAVSPKTFPKEAFEPVPYVLAAYLVLSVINLTWSLVRQPPDWTAYVSILFDFTLLYGLMLSFHIQYMQPASFILKAPALLYVFIFISIRSLRFHPKFVIVAGVTAALGWALLIYYVIRVDPHDSMLTRSYVHYLTSNSILIGAEVDKVVSILSVTAILALAVNGSKNLLIRSVTEQTAAAELSKFFDEGVAREIRGTRERIVAGTGEKRLATIVNIDIRGFTRLVAERDADEVMQLLSAYQAKVIPIIRTHGGTVDKFMGDGVLVSFGIDDGSKEAAARALAAAEQLLIAFPSWPLEDACIREFGPVDICIGISTGTVSWGAVGHENRLEMTVIGAPVNLSAKLEKLNRRIDGSACISDLETWNAGRRQGYAGSLEARHVRTPVEGVAGDMDVMVLKPTPMTELENRSRAGKMPEVDWSEKVAGVGSKGEITG
jgi:adenylate cyclase